MNRYHAVLLLLALIGTACAGRQVVTTPKLTQDVDRLMNELDLLPPFPKPIPSSGSIWTDGGPGAALARDPRAFRLNDLLTVRLDERSVGSNESQTQLNRSSEANIGAGIAFGVEKENPRQGSFNLNQVLESGSESKFAGDGTTTRRNSLSGSVTARVMRVLPNGDLVIAGQKTVTINRERQVLTLVGSVRPLDIGPDNRVTSSSVGELTVRLWGRGEIDATIRQGWFMRVMNRVWPF